MRKLNKVRKKEIQSKMKLKQYQDNLKKEIEDLKIIDTTILTYNDNCEHSLERGTALIKENLKSQLQGSTDTQKILIDEMIKWLNFEFDRFDIITKESKRSEKVRYLFLNELMKKREELKERIKQLQEIK
jgi:hypothetical protein